MRYIDELRKITADNKDFDFDNIHLIQLKSELELQAKLGSNILEVPEDIYTIPHIQEWIASEGFEVDEIKLGHETYYIIIWE